MILWSVLDFLKVEFSAMSLCWIKHSQNNVSFLIQVWIRMFEFFFLFFSKRVRKYCKIVQNWIHSSYKMLICDMSKISGESREPGKDVFLISKPRGNQGLLPLGRMTDRHWQLALFVFILPHIIFAHCRGYQSSMHFCLPPTFFLLFENWVSGFICCFTHV